MIGARQEHPEVVRFAALEVVNWQGSTHVPQVDEPVDLAVGIASDVYQGGVARGLLAQALQRHDREQRLDGPVIWQALEEAGVETGDTVFIGTYELEWQ